MRRGRRRSSRRSRPRARVGRADALAGRYLHAEHDDVEDLIASGRDRGERPECDSTRR
jgi:hypothetical protein